MALEREEREAKSRRALFEEIYRSHYNKVLFFAYNYVKESEKAENIAQDVFMAFWNEINSVKEISDSLPYLFVMTK